MEPPAAEPGSDDDDDEGKPRDGWRSAHTQVVIVGFLAFCGPGLFNALTGLGGAGSSDPAVAAVANGCLYCTFAASSYFAGAAFNLLGPVPLFVFGGLMYAVYATCVYFSGQVAPGPDYFVYSSFFASLGGVLLGVGAGLFWTAQGALMMAYATPQSRGRLIGLFWIIFNLGGVAGGLLALGLNYNNPAGDASAASYFSFIAAMLAGALLSPCLLVRPSQVVREDGSPVAFEQARSPWEELVAAFEAFGDPFVRRNLLFWFASNWFYTYDFNGFNGSQFNVRTRGLNSALFWAAQMLAAWTFGGVLDGPQAPAKRAVWGMTLVVIALLVSLVPAIWLNYTSSCGGGYGFDKDSPCLLDFMSDFQTSAAPMLVFTLLGAADAMYQNYAYWLMSMASGGDVRKMVQYSAAYKGTQSLGAGIAWLSDLGDGFSYHSQGVFALTLTLMACAPVVPTFKLLDGGTDKPERRPSAGYGSPTPVGRSES